MFKIGQKVTCVDPMNSSFKKGATYTIRYVREDGTMLQVKEVTGTYYSYRFVLTRKRIRSIPNWL